MIRPMPPVCAFGPLAGGARVDCPGPPKPDGGQAGSAPATARLLNPGLNEYLIPTHADAPPISVTFIEEHDPDISPLGSKGIGELPVVGAAPAIANAVFHATGRRVRHLRSCPRTSCKEDLKPPE
jgi:hypothetical protein